MKIVFMGTPGFAVPTLETLHEKGYPIFGVFTQPDRPAGRGKKLTPSPVKCIAERLQLPVFQPTKIKTPEPTALLKEMAPDCIVVVAYGQILSTEILQIPPLGCINVHASLLPAYRGAAPIHWSVLNGETKTGITTMRMDEGLDTGEMLLSATFPIGPNATTGEVHDALAQIGANLLIETLKGLEKGSLHGRKQPAEYTYAPLLKREHEQIDWSWDAQKIHNRIRGLHPWPGAFTRFREEQMKVWESRLVLEDAQTSPVQKGSLPGEILMLTKTGILLNTGAGLIEIKQVQPAGKNRMNALDYYHGRRLQIGECFY